MASSIRFDGGTLKPRLEKAPARLERYMSLTTQYYAQQAERQARLGAPWTDRTGNARNGLRGFADPEPNVYGIILAHSVPYGIWLEVRWGGRYATIIPTLRRVGPQYIAAMTGLMGSM